MHLFWRGLEPRCHLAAIEPALPHSPLLQRTREMHWQSCAAPSSRLAAKLSQEFPDMVLVCCRLRCQIILYSGTLRWGRGPCQGGAASLRPGLLIQTQIQPPSEVTSIFASPTPPGCKHKLQGGITAKQRNCSWFQVGRVKMQPDFGTEQPRSYRQGQDQAWRFVTQLC